MRVYCIPTGTEIADAGRTVFVFERAFRNKQFEKKMIRIGPETAKLQAFFCRSLEGLIVVVCLTTAAAAANGTKGSNSRASRGLLASC